MGGRIGSLLMYFRVNLFAAKYYEGSSSRTVLSRKWFFKCYDPTMMCKNMQANVDVSLLSCYSQYKVLRIKSCLYHFLYLPSHHHHNHHHHHHHHNNNNKKKEEIHRKRNGKLRSNELAFSMHPMHGKYA